MKSIKHLAMGGMMTRGNSQAVCLCIHEIRGELSAFDAPTFLLQDQRKHSVVAHYRAINILRCTTSSQWSEAKTKRHALRTINIRRCTILSNHSRWVGECDRKTKVLTILHTTSDNNDEGTEHLVGETLIGRLLIHLAPLLDLVQVKPSIHWPGLCSVGLHV